jgi:hypothetical protein
MRPMCKIPTGSSEQLLCFILIGCLVLLCVMGIRISNANEIGVIQRERIKVSMDKVKVYEEEIDELKCRISFIESERDSIQNLRNQIHVKTVHIIDSVYALPFEGKSEFFSAEVTRIDSIRKGYLSSNN